MSERILQVTHEGTLKIGDKKIACAVLENGIRILTQSAVYTAFDRPRRGRRKRDPAVKLDNKTIQVPSFLAANNLIPYYITNEAIIELLQGTKYRTRSGKIAKGYRAEILPLLADVWLHARQDGAKLNHLQIEVTKKVEILVRALAKVGIDALIDEATGYQEFRDKKALQALLDKYLRKELAAWAKKFPDEFYIEMFRLRGWQWKGMKINNRPGVVGRYTNNIVYSRLAPGLIKELEEKNPKTDKGHRKSKHHQWLSDDIGNPALAQHLHACIALMKTCGNNGWNQFMRNLNRAFPKKEEQLEWDLEE